MHILWSHNATCLLQFITSKAKENEAMLDAAYTDEEKANILDCFNKCSETELMFTKQLNKVKASAVVSYRSKYGNFDNLSTVLKVPGIGILGLQKLCSTLKDKNALAVQKLKHLSAVETVRCYPNLAKSECKAVDSIISLELQADRLSWVKMNRDLEVEQWRQSVLFDKPYPRFDHVIYLNQVQDFVSSLPSCSLYTLENKQLRVPSLKVVPLIVNLKCLETMLITVLNNDVSDAKKHRVHLIKPTMISRYFNLLVGGERVSGQHVVRDILLGQSEIVTDVVIPAKLRDSYFRHESFEQERLSSCLLQAIAFLKLIVCKNDQTD
ncbi:transcription elongation factor, mitochondrial-like isoform X2 [Liolophura sinensis]|uniref:transcription elongation factor, mitochondrial-like isoform X2 n=1 Tax=Liolophura sinensis TaxID=3198878 RepID=UPI00315877BF